MSIQNDEKWGYEFHFANTPLHQSYGGIQSMLTNLELCSLSVLGRPIEYKLQVQVDTGEQRQEMAGKGYHVGLSFEVPSSKV